MTTITTQSDLVALFQRHLTLGHVHVFSEEKTRMEEPINYSISQHYHHSAHAAVEQSETSELLHTPHVDQNAIESFLSSFGVNFRSLHPSQVELFQTADADQQRRLIELWQICPPDYDGRPDDVEVSRTSIEHEESKVMLRMGQQLQQQLESSAVEDQWDHIPSAEPYMITGYDLSAVSSAPQYTHSTDPVYNKAAQFGGDWAALIAQRRLLTNCQPNAHRQQSPWFDGEDEEML